MAGQVSRTVDLQDREDHVCRQTRPDGNLDWHPIRLLSIFGLQKRRLCLERRRLETAVVCAHLLGVPGHGFNSELMRSFWSS